MNYTDNQLFILCEKILSDWGIKVAAVAKAAAVPEEKVRSLKRKPPKSSADKTMIKGLLYYFGTIIMEELENEEKSYETELVGAIRDLQQQSMEERGAVSLLQRFEKTDKKLDMLLEQMGGYKKREED